MQMFNNYNKQLDEEFFVHLLQIYIYTHTLTDTNTHTT